MHIELGGQLWHDGAGSNSISSMEDRTDGSEGKFCPGENNIRGHAPHPSILTRVKMMAIGEQSPKTI